MSGGMADKMTKKDPTAEKFLLYIDILGFTEMALEKPRKVEQIFATIDTLNVHQHGSFKTIVFSDTILVYNKQTAVTDKEKNYLVLYLIEFAEDLHHRLTGQDVYFRAIITSGKFKHYQLENVECFFGQALVNAYRQEKDIPAIGLFIDAACNAHNEYFRLEPFGNGLSFVYLNRALESLHEMSGGKYPVIDPSILAMGFPFLPWQVRFLKDIYQQMRTHKNAKVRIKSLATWDFHKRRYNTMLSALEQGGFALSNLVNDSWFDEEAKTMERDIYDFKRIIESEGQV